MKFRFSTLIMILFLASSVHPTVYAEIMTNDQEMFGGTETGNGGDILTPFLLRAYRGGVMPTIHFAENQVHLGAAVKKALANRISGNLPIRVETPAYIPADRYFDHLGQPALVRNDRMLDYKGREVDARVVKDSQDGNRIVMQFDKAAWFRYTHNATKLPKERIDLLTHELFRFAWMSGDKVPNDEDYTISSILMIPPYDENDIDFVSGKGLCGSKDKATEIGMSFSQVDGVFRMQTTEVTQAMWRTVMGTKPAALYTSRKDCPNDYNDAVPGYCPHNPVFSISADEIEQFISHMNTQSESCTYRLPFESEYERAAKGAAADGGKDISKMAWCNKEGLLITDPDNLKKPEFLYITHPVGSKMPNRHGIYDLMGNVAEVVQMKTADIRDPSLFYVLRGGNAMSSSKYCSPYGRTYFDKNLLEGDGIMGRWVDLHLTGMRLIRDVKPQPSPDL